jgi:hypothetical protein
MSYAHALRTAGAEVVDFKEIGSYQGTWGAVVDFQGQRSLVTGYYGSCSHCDAYQSQFDRYSSDEPYFDEETGKYYSDRWQEQEITKEAYEADQEEQKQRLIDFGMSYLRNPMTEEDVKKRIEYYDSNDNGEWSFDSEERELYDWAITLFK